MQIVACGPFVILHSIISHGVNQFPFFFFFFQKSPKKGGGVGGGGGGGGTARVKGTGLRIPGVFRSTIRTSIIYSYYRPHMSIKFEYLFVFARVCIFQAVPVCRSVRMEPLVARATLLLHMQIGQAQAQHPLQILLKHPVSVVGLESAVLKQHDHPVKTAV